MTFFCDVTNSGNCPSLGIIACHKICSGISQYEHFLVKNETDYLTSALLCRLIQERDSGRWCLWWEMLGLEKSGGAAGNLADWQKSARLNKWWENWWTGGKLKRWEDCGKTLVASFAKSRNSSPWKKFDRAASSSGIGIDTGIGDVN